MGILMSSFEGSHEERQEAFGFGEYNYLPGGRAEHRP
jgi:hypothetical protein